MSKRTIIIVALAVFGVAIPVGYGLIARGFLHQRRQQAALKDQIAPLATAQAGSESGERLLATRQAELATAEAELAEARLSFPRHVNNIEVLGYVVDAAEDHNVNLAHAEAREPLTTTIGTGAYRVFAYDVEVEGTLDTISSFLKAVESGDIKTLTLDQIRLEAQSTPTGTYRASLVVQVYVRP